MEALMTLDCSNYSENIVEVLKIFQQIGRSNICQLMMTMSMIGNVKRKLKVNYMILFLKRLLAKNR